MEERTYFVLIDWEDPIVVTVKGNVNRPNNPDCDDILNDYMVENYGLNVEYEHFEISTCPHISI